MKNLKSAKMKTCIFLEKEELEQIIFEESSLKVKVCCDHEGLRYEPSNSAEYQEDSFYIGLVEKHFGISVDTVHIDDCDNVGIWITVRTTNDKNSRLKVIQSLVSNVLNEAPFEDDCTDEENDLYVEMQNLKKAITQYLQNE